MACGPRPQPFWANHAAHSKRRLGRRRHRVQANPPVTNVPGPDTATFDHAPAEIGGAAHPFHLRSGMPIAPR
jgi:hypothetical protein